MSLLIWFMIGLAIWHFTVFVRDRFRGGIIGAFVGAVVGAMVGGAVWQIASGASIGTTDMLTVLAPTLGSLVGLYITYQLGIRDERRYGAAEAE